MCLSYQQSNKTLTANGVDFHYALDGEVSKPVLALINMASVNLTAWEPVLAKLLKSYRILRFDIRGTGKSAWGTDDEFTFSQYADDLAAIMDVLNIPKAFVLGVAYGARTAAQFALRHENKLTGLALFDVALTPPVEQSQQKILAAKARELLKEASEPEIEFKKSWRFYENRDAALKAHTAHQHEPDTSNMMGHLKVPVLVACGRQDMNLNEAQRIAKVIPGGKFELMEMTGHGSPFFRPDHFANIVNDFHGQLIL
ncbi:alpha/beta fold hydrolase [Paraglaciecola arctica]|uniref:3-oxoadipate enol-lactone hydrolase n=1 Tax=Paraglaciecola arctica BSs20135 TaxID=493475 RepID=K6Z3L4_9ALTE|nr:alpha/beta hydrolase [Paraglaciecola arctica]GAC18030.1 3-oxoadipate enol-lactone hydrolase [Paraglaciecola arctica BSs20135]